MSSSQHCMQHAADSRAAVRAGVILHAVCYKHCPVLIDSP